MCEYCEGKKELKSCNFSGDAKMRIHKDGFEEDIGLLEIYGDEGRFSLFKRIYLPRFDINYCPICGKRLGKRSD